MKKRYAGLILLTAAIIFVLLVWKKYHVESAAAIRTFCVQPVTMQETLRCSGKIERTFSKKIYPETLGIVKNVFVKKGDIVRKGEALFEIQEIKTNILAPETMQVFSILYGDEKVKSSSSGSESKTVTAPVWGEIVSVSIQKGEYTDPTQAAIVISEKEGMQLRLKISETKISEIELGQKAVITGNGFNDSIYCGKITMIDDEAKSILTNSGQETTVEVVLTIENPQKEIKPGYTASAEILLSQNELLLIPYEAVEAEKDGHEYVLVLKDHTLKKQYITTGKEYAEGFSVTSGLVEGDIIVPNASSFHEGQSVKETERSMMKNAG